jgi:signal transduction histidine kinase
VTKPSPKGTAALLAAVQGLTASNDLTELAGAAAQLAHAAVQSTAALVLLRGTQATYRGGGASAPGELSAWAEELLQEGNVAGVAHSRGKWATPVNARALGFHGVIVVSEPALSDEEARAVLAELGRVVSTSLTQFVSRGQGSGTAPATRAALAKGLHDLRTPLNSLRLGMHLLAPGLAGQDQAVVDRTHRAIDRMAALVTEMFESLPEQ